MNKERHEFRTLGNDFSCRRDQSFGNVNPFVGDTDNVAVIGVVDCEWMGKKQVG